MLAPGDWLAGTGGEMLAVHAFPPARTARPTMRSFLRPLAALAWLSATALVSPLAGAVVVYSSFETKTEPFVTTAGDPLSLFASGLGYQDAVISGDGPVTIGNSGVVVYLQDNTYTGTTTITSGGGLLLGNNTTSGSVAGNIVAHDLLEIRRSDSYLFANLVSGSGSLKHSGSGLLTLTANHTYTGATTIQGTSVLQLGNGGTTGSVAGDITFGLSNSTIGGLIFNRSDDFTFAGAISNYGSITKAGGNVLTLTGNNTFLGGANLADGTLVLGSATALGSGGAISFAGGTLRFTSANAVDYSGRISTAAGQDFRIDTNGRDVTFASGLSSSGGSLTKLGAGTLVLGGNAVDGTTISAGTLYITGAVSGDIANSGALILDQSAPTTYWHTLSGTGSFTKRGSGTLTLAGTNTFTGATSLEGGTIRVGSAGALGSGGTFTFAGGGLEYAAGVTHADASSRFAVADGSDYLFNVEWQGTATIGSALAGGAGLTKSGDGTLILSGNNTYTGDTTIGAGFLHVGSGGTTGSLAGDVINNGRLIFDRSDDFGFGGTISGTGDVHKRGAGRLTLGAGHTTTGHTLIEAGTLRIVEGSLSSPMRVDSGATLELHNGGTFDAWIRGLGTLRIMGGTAVLTYGNTLAGPIVLDYGTLELGHAGALGSFGTIGFVEGTLKYTSVNAVDYSARFSSADNERFNVDTNGRDVTFATGLASSGGTLRKSGSGTLTLAGDSTYTGATTVAGGTLRLGAGGSTGSVAGAIDIESGTSLVINRSDDTTIANAITGLGSVTKSGTNAVTLTGANAYSGGTTLASGTVVLGGSGALGTAGSVAFTGGTLRFSSANTGDYSARIANSTSSINLDTNGESPTFVSAIDSTNTGGLTKSGAGTLTLVGNNTYTGTTTIAAGTLAIGNNGSSGSVAGDIVNEASLVFSRTGSLTHAGAISGSGSVANSGNGLVTLTGDNSYTGGTIVNAGVLALGSAGALGPAGTIGLNGGYLRFTSANTADYSSRFSAAAGQAYRFDTNGQDVTLATALTSSGATLTKQGTGTLTLAADGTFGGLTTVVGGTLQLGSGGAAGAVGGTIQVFSGGALAYNRSDAYSPAGTVANAGQLTLTGGGTLLLTGSITGTGTTRIVDGTLRLGNGASITNSIVNNDALVVDRTDTSSLGSAISGSGTLTVAGSGSVFIAGNNSFTGGTSLAAGTIQLGHANALGTSGALAFTGGTLQHNPGFIPDYSGRIAGSTGAMRINTGGANVTYASGLASSNTGGLIKLGAGSLSLNGANAYTGGTTVSGGTLTLGTGGSIAGAIVNNATLAFSGTDMSTHANDITGTGAVNKSGTGTVTLSGDNAYTGGTTLGAGTLEVGSANALGPTGTLSFGGGTLRLSAANASDYSARFSTAAAQLYRLDTNGQDVAWSTALTSASGSLAKLGDGMLTLEADNTFSGTTQVLGGTLRLGTGGSVGSLAGAITVASGATLDVNRSGAFSPASFITNAGTIALSGGPAMTLTTSISGGGTLNLGTGTLNISDGGSVANSIVNPVALTFTRSSGSTSHSGAISGAGTLTKAGAGTVVLTADNTYSGGTTVSAGVLQVGSFGATGDIGSGDITVAPGATLAFSRTGTLVVEGAISGAGTLTKNSGGTLVLAGDATHTGGTTVSIGTLQIGGGGTTGSLTGNVAASGTLAFNRSDALSYHGLISGSGALQKLGAGTLTLTADHTFTGVTTISGGTLQLGTGGTAGRLASNSITVGSGATLAISRSDDLTVSALISGAGGFTKSGAGTLTLTGNNTYGGGTTVAAGTLELGDGGSSGWAGSGNISVADGATLAINRASNVSYAGVISGAGAINKLGDGTLALSGENTHTGTFTISAGTVQIGDYADVFATTTSGSLAGSIVNNAALVFFRGEDVTHAGAISGTGTVTTNGYSTLTLTGNNSYTGGTAINGGTLELGSAGALGTAGSISFNGGALRFTAANVQDYSSRISSAPSQAYSLDTNGQNVTFATGFGAADSFLGKRGAGTLTLSGSNSFGMVSVEAGTLAVSSSGSLGPVQHVSVLDGATLAVAGAGLTFAEGQTLAGAGTLAGAFTIGAGAHLAPGQSPGTMTFTDGLTLASGAVLDFELGSASDLIRVTGGVLAGPAGSGGITLNVFDSGDFAPATYVLFDFAGATTSGFDLADFSFGDVVGGYAYSLGFVGSTLALTATAVPEPSTYALLAGVGALGLAGCRRRTTRLRR